MINSHEDLVEFLVKQFPDEEIGWTGPGTWAPLTHSLKMGVLHLWEGEGDFYYFFMDGTKVFMSPWAKEGEITFSRGSFPITGLDFVRIQFAFSLFPVAFFQPGKEGTASENR